MDPVGVVSIGLGRAPGERLSPEHETIVLELLSSRDRLVHAVAGYPCLVRHLLTVVAGLKGHARRELQRLATHLALG